LKIMIPPARPSKKAGKNYPFRFLRPMALLTAAIGATGSVGEMLRVGQRNPSKLLLLAFVLWDVSPFVALAVADGMSKRWTPQTRKTIYLLMFLFAVGSLAIYGYIAFGPSRKKPAAMFLIVPFASWVIMSIAIPISARMSRAPRSRRSSI